MTSFNIFSLSSTLRAVLSLKHLISPYTMEVVIQAWVVSDGYRAPQDAPLGFICGDRSPGRFSLWKAKKAGSSLLLLWFDPEPFWFSQQARPIMEFPPPQKSQAQSIPMKVVWSQLRQRFQLFYISESSINKLLNVLKIFQVYH